jgi:hypothetical protein
MSTITFRKATKKQAKLRLAFVGPAGSGKTYSALEVASHLGERIAVLDTERGSASKYADIFAFDAVEPETFSPDTYVEAIRAAEDAGYDVLVIDSLSHAWMGKDGALELVDQAAKRSKSGNSFAAWREVTPKHNALVDAVIGARMHIIATMRAKTEWVIVENDKGKKEPKKLGLAPIQRDGLEYEFDVVGDLDHENSFVVSKSRCPALTGKVINRPGKELATALRAWLSDGEEAPPAAVPQPWALQQHDVEAARLVDELIESFTLAATIGELETIGREINAADLGRHGQRLRASYTRQRNALKKVEGASAAELDALANGASVGVRKAIDVRRDALPEKGKAA